MKRTLRVLFLAVLAMTLMASGAFATSSSFDVASGDNQTVTLNEANNWTTTVHVYVNLSKDKPVLSASVKETTTVRLKLGKVNSGDATGTTYSKDIYFTVSCDSSTTATTAIITLTIQSGEVAGEVETVKINVTIEPKTPAREESPDIESITFDKADPISIGLEEVLVTATVAVTSNNVTFTADNITIGTDGEPFTLTEDEDADVADILTAEISGDIVISDDYSAFTVPIKISGIGAGTAQVGLFVQIGDGESCFDSFDVEVAEDNPEEDDGIAWKDATALDTKHINLYIDEEGNPQTQPFEVSITVSDTEAYLPENVSFSITEKTSGKAPTNWKFTSGKGTADTTSPDIYIYTLTFTPVASQDPVDYTMYAFITDDETVSTEPGAVNFTVAVIDSGDEPGNGPSTLTMVSAVAENEKISQAEKVKVTVTVKPMATAGTYTFADPVCETTNNFSVNVYTDDTPDEASQTNSVVFELQADVEEDPGDYTFTFNVTSGSQTVSAEVTFTVEELDLSQMDDSERAEFIKNNPAPAPEVSGSGLGGSLSGTVKFTMTSKWPVHPRGWLVKFYNGTTFFDWLMSLMRWLVGGEEYSANESALISVLGMIADEDNAGAIQTDASTDSKSAEYTMEVDDVAAGGLANGTDYGVKPAIIPAAYYDYIDGTNVTSEDAASETEDSIGTITGTTGGGGGGSTDEILPGSSGGCDAGFGTLALALAATLFLSKKRS